MSESTLSGDAASGDAAHIAELYRDIYAVVRKIPKGKVVTYGQLAELAGRPGAARVAGAAMRGCPKELGLPWHRVVGKKGKGKAKVSIYDPMLGAVQRKLLEGEGVEFGVGESISLHDFGWLPEDA